MSRLKINSIAEQNEVFLNATDLYTIIYYKYIKKAPSNWHLLGQSQK